MWGAIAALVASAALQQINSSMAVSRQNQATRDALKRQRDYQMRAEKIVMDNADDYRQDTREQNQNKIAEEMTGNYYRPVETAQTAHAEAATTQGNVSSDYRQAKTASDANQLNTARELAGLLGRQNSAYRLRQNEAIKMADNASEISRINNFANGMYNVNRLAIQEAGQANPFLQLGSSILGMYGTSALGSAAAGATGSVTGTSAGAALTGKSGVGLLDSGFANTLKNGAKYTGGVAFG